MKVKFISTFLLCSILFMGCATRRIGSKEIHHCTFSDVKSSIINGKTQKEEIIERFGTTFNLIFDEAGREQWIYQYRKASIHKNTLFVAKHLVVIFDENDTVIHHVFYSNLEDIK